VGLAWTGCAATVIRTPRLKVDYDPPRLWLASGTQTRLSAKIKNLAQKLKARDPWVTLRRIHRWVVNHSQPQKKDRGELMRARTATQLFEARTLTGCGDWALLLAALFRAAGLPTVYVEAIHKDWARRWSDGTAGSTHMGHTFLEVYVGGEWILIDSTKGYYWTGYDRKNPNLPRGYYAFAKGRDAWDVGIKSLSILNDSLEAIADHLSTKKLAKPSYRQGYLTPHLVLVSNSKIRKALKSQVTGLRFVFLPLRRLRKKPHRADGKNVLVLLGPKALKKRLQLLSSPLLIQNPERALPPDPGAYPRVLKQNDRSICIIVASKTKDLIKKALSVIAVKDEDERALRPERCGRPSQPPPAPRPTGKEKKRSLPPRKRPKSKGRVKKGAALFSFFERFVFLFTAPVSKPRPKHHATANH
jgi:hypothetical protein